MKVFRKGIAVLLSVTMLLALCATAFATDIDDTEDIDNEEVQTVEVADTQETAKEVSEEIVENDISDIVEDIEDVEIVEETPIEETEPVEIEEKTSITDEDTVTSKSEDIQTYSVVQDVEGENNDIDTYASKTKLDVVFVMGQSNAQGLIDGSYSTARQQSVSCNSSDIYSTVIPFDLNGAQWVTGVSYSSGANANNIGDFVPKSLSSSETYNGGTLNYPLNWLSNNGGGKSGLDAGFAYKWHELTQDAVWVVNISFSGSRISQWESDSGVYTTSVEAMKLVMQTYANEVSSSGQYDAGDVFMIWQQGESDCWADPYTSVTDYTNEFMTMYNGFKNSGAFKTYPLEACGFVTIRRDQSTTSTSALEDISAREAQLEMANKYSDIFIASDANEDWIGDTNTKTYFNYWYPNGIQYPTHKATADSGLAKPTTVSEVYSGVHYFQIGHNENGITAANGMYNILYKGATTGSTKNAINSSLVYPAAGDGSDVVEQSDGRWAYVKNGKIDTSFTGFASNVNDWWYIQDGYVNFGITGIVYGNLGNVYGQWYVSGGKVQVDYTGLTYESIGSKWYYISDGKLDTNYTGVASNQNGWYYVKGGYVNFSYTGLAMNENGWWYCEGGKVTFEYHGLVYGTVNGTYGQWYVDKSKVQLDYSGNYYDTYWGTRYISNGLAYAGVSSFTTDQYGNDTIHLDNGTTIVPSGITKGNDGNYYYYVNGTVATGTTSVVESYAIDNTDGWYYVENGKVNFDYTGLAENQYGWWYIDNGEVNFGYNGIVANQYWADGWYVVSGQVQFGYTGVANYASSDGTWYYINAGKVDKTKTSIEPNDYGWWRVVNGVVDFSCNSIEQNDYGWWYLEGGKVIFSYTGFGKNSYGYWYIIDGKVDFSVNSVLQDTNGTIDGTVDSWWYVVGGKVQTTYGDASYTGVTNYSNDYGWWYVKDGKVDFSVTSVEQNDYGWWYVYEGKVNFNYTGLALNGNGWWYCENGQVLFNYTGFAYSYESTGRGDHWAYCFNSYVDESYNDIIQDVNNTIGNGNTAWYYIDSGWVYANYTDVSNFSNTNGWWYITNGQVNFSYTGLAKNDYGWWYVNGGKVDFSYTGFAENQWGWWYVTKGEVTFEDDIVEDTQKIVDGTDSWYYCPGGCIDFTYTNKVSNFANAYGWWYIVNGKVDFSFTGTASNDYGTWNVVNGKVVF